VVGVVHSYYPFLALLLAEGTTALDCYKLPKNYKKAFSLLQTNSGRNELSFAIGKRIQDIDWSLFNRQLNAIDAHRVAVVTHRQSHYPAYLRDIPSSPPVLFYKGDLARLARRGVAVVGSRNASARGCRFATTLASDLSACGIMVVSGLARGIDTAAHRGALNHSGSTVAVIGTGLDVVYPSRNAALLETIAQAGCVLTEQVMGTTPRSFVFPLRNRLISAMSHMVVVVEAAARSGALVTVKWALEQGRDVGAVPGFPGDPRSQGANRLLKTGAYPIESIDDIFEAVPLLKAEAPNTAPGAPREERRGVSLPSAEAARVLEALSSSPVDPDTLALHVQKPVATVQRLLLELEMRGLVARDAAGGYHRS
jgi:DNA processing protein